VRECRCFITDHCSILGLLDLTGHNVFSASVYPIVIYLKKSKPSNDKTSVITVNSKLKIGVVDPYADMIADILERCISLGEVAIVSGAATGSEAYDIKKLIVPCKTESVPEGYGRFVVSGNIRPFRTTWETDPVQYLKDRYFRPVVELEKLPSRRRKQSTLPKVIVSGMAQRPTAFLDRHGEYVTGKSTVLVYDAKPGWPLEFVEAYLDSSLGLLIYKALYGSLALAGGYMRFGPPQLAAMPVPAHTIRWKDGHDFDKAVCEAFGVALDTIMKFVPTNNNDRGPAKRRRT